VVLRGAGSNVYADTVRGYFESIVGYGPRRVVVDLSGLTFINSMLVGVLVEFRGRLTEIGATLTLRATRGPVLQVLKRCHVADLLG